MLIFMLGTFDKLSMGTLYIAATPIGNLEDITLRALRVLKEVDVIYAEDTRVTKKLLQKYEIESDIQRLDAHKENEKVQEVVNRLASDERVAYVSDAGTPAISDPGFRLVQGVREAGLRVEVIPGASSVTAALSVAGIKADAFTFLGFLPHKKGRQTALKDIAESKHTVVLFESTHRILKLLSGLVEHIDDRQVCLARELTKLHEEVLCGTAQELKSILEENAVKQKGEFVVIVSSG